MTEREWRESKYSQLIAFHITCIYKTLDLCIYDSYLQFLKTILIWLLSFPFFFISVHTWSEIKRKTTSNLACFIYLPNKTFEPPHDKTNTTTVCPARTQISLGIRPVWSESSLCAQWVAKDPRFRYADSEVSDQTGRMPRRIWVFAGDWSESSPGAHAILLVLSWGGSLIKSSYSD